MNKVTLSAAALTAIVVPAQVQAADLTPDQIKAKQGAIDELRIQLNAAANAIKAQAPDVQEEYLLKLSQITAEMNALYNDNTKDLTADQKNTWTAGIDAAKTGAAEAQKPYTVKKELQKKFDALNTLYQARLAIASDKTAYPNVSDTKVKALKALGVEALGKQIDAYNPAETTILDDQTTVETAIKTVTSAIKNLTDKIAEEEAAVANNEAAHQAVVDAYNAAKADYNAQLQEAISKLPSEVYKDWQDEAVEKLNEQYRLINDAKKADEALYADGKSATAKGQYVNDITTAQAEIANIVGGYLADMQNEEDAKADADAAVKGLQDALNAVKKQLTDRKLTDCDADIAAVQTSIDNLNAELDGQYKKHELYGYKYAVKVTNIQIATNKIDDNGNPPHPYADVIANYDAKEDMNTSIAAAQKTLDDNVKAAGKVSADKKYNAAAYLTGNQKTVQDAIDKLSNDVKVQYDAKTAVKYKNETFDGKLAPITKGNTDYKANAAAALAAYNQAQKTAADAEPLLKALKDKVTDPNVTVNGTTYQAKINKIQGEIEAIKNAIKAALNLKDAAHLKAIKAAAAKTISENIQQLTDDYEANKTEYDRLSAVSAANAVFTASQNRIDAVKEIINSITDGDDFGNQAEAIATAKAAAETELDKVQKTRDDAKSEFDAVTDKVEQQAAAAKAIEVLATVNDQLTTLETTVNDLKAKADAAKANKVAYDAVSTMADGVQTLVEDVRDNTVMTVATDAAQVTYLAKITKMLQDIAAAKTELETAYGQIKAAEKQEGIEKKLTGIETAAKDLKAAVQPNENAHIDQVADATNLQATWQTVYDTISNTDLSDAAAGYLQELAKQQEAINNLKKKVEDAFAACESDKQKEAIEADRKAIEDAITKIGNESKDNYDANVDKTNADQHSNFEAAYKNANDKFTEAVNALNKFSNIKNAASVTALDELIPTHDAIYAYADKLRKLKAEESKKYDEYLADVTDGENDIYSSVTYVNDADKYAGEIDSLLKEYQDKVNQVAKAQYDSLIPQAENLVAQYEAKISTFIYDGKANAFKDVKDVVKEAKKAGAIEADGTISDDFYAVHMDEWLETLNNVGSPLTADLKVASKAEKAKRLKVTKDLYESEKTAIAGFGEIDNAQYLQELETLKTNTIDVAEQAGDSYNSVLNTVIVKCEAYAQYTADKNKYHSNVYKQAYAASAASKQNVAAYNRMIENLDMLVADANGVKASVESLVVGHMGGTTYAQLKAIADYLSNKRTEVESWKENGNCVANESGYNTTVPATVQSLIDNLKLMAVSDEVAVLNAKIDEVKEEYNQVAKTNLDAVKDYDAEIQKLSDDVAEISTKFNDMKDKALDAAFGGAVEELANQEVEIAAVNKALNDMYENTQTADAVTSVNKAINNAETAVEQAEKWAGYNDATQAFAGAEVQALRGELELIKADYEAKNAAGQILFYSDNIIFDLGNVANAAPNTNSDLKKLYDKHLLNDNVYNTLLGTLNSDIEALNTAYDKIKDFKHLPSLHGVSLVEWNKNQLEEEFGFANEDLETAHKAVELTWNHYLNSSINNYSNDIDAFERDAKKYEADGMIGDVQDDINASLDIIKESLYGGDREAQLRNEYRRINKLLTYAYNYNADAADDDYISIDIDGKDVTNALGNPAFADYKTTAWETLKNRIAELTEDAAQLASNVVELSYIEGDANNDKVVNVEDYDMVRGWILNATKYDEVSEAQRYAADHDDDGQFTVADMTNISKIIFDEDWQKNAPARVSAKTRAKATAEDEMTITAEGEETTIFGKTVRMAVNLTHSEAFTAGQMDIIMPQGMKLVGQSMSDRANGHEVLANDLGNGVSRIVAATIDNNEFNGRSGALIYLDVEVGSDYNGGQITVDNVIFSDAMANRYNLVEKAGIVTGIDGIEAATVKERIYSVGGQMMKAVKKGINIIVGEDGKARKVVNKK